MGRKNNKAGQPNREAQQVRHANRRWINEQYKVYTGNQSKPLTFHKEESTENE